MQRLFLAVAAAAALAACADRTPEPVQTPLGRVASPPAATNPIENSGQSGSVTSGSTSNVASGSRATPTR
jgi:hypothetical protein